MKAIELVGVPVAKLDIASGYGPEDWGFESLQARQKNYWALRGSDVCRAGNSSSCA